jgi:SAM-dependent methyltransferase
VKNTIKNITPMVIRLSVWEIRHVSFWHGIRYFVHFFIEKFRLILDNFSKNETAVKCICCGESFSRFVHFIGYDYMPGSFRCPRCESYQRHRFLHYFMEKEVLPKYGKGVILRFSPESTFDLLIKRYPELIYYGTDICTKGVSGRLSFLSDAQSLPLLDESIDLIVSIHVLEHLPSDFQAIREICRVLSPEGVAIVMVPQERREFTLEYYKPNAREHNHYRVYGRDFIERLSSCFGVSVISANEFAPRKMLEFGSEKLFICKKKQTGHKQGGVV